MKKYLLVSVVCCCAAWAHAQVTTSTEWAWMTGDTIVPGAAVYGPAGVDGPDYRPDARYGAATWSDGSGTLWLFGGDDYGARGDLWKYNGATNQWAWIKGDSTGTSPSLYGVKGVAYAGTQPARRLNAATWMDVSGNLWMFGGATASPVVTSGVRNDLWKYNPTTNQWTWISGDSTIDASGIYGSKGVAAAANVPGARTGALSWTDAAGNFWLFGGNGFDGGSTIGYLNDLWKYNPATNQWTWISGDNTINSFGVYGTQGTAASTNKPGARRSGVAWKDLSGNLWLLGGAGLASSGSLSDLGDLWKYDPVTDQWTWMKGNSTGGSNYGSYGTQGVAAATNKPGGGRERVGWVDASGNFWLFGGAAYTNNLQPDFGVLCILWKYDPATNMWTWMNGPGIARPTGVYGIMGVPDAANHPGGRAQMSGWADNNGNLHVFGGRGITSNSGYENPLNDIWKYNIATNQWAWIKGGGEMDGFTGVYGTKGTPSPSNTPGQRAGATTWTDNAGNFWLFGGYGYAVTGGSYTYLNDLWKYDRSINQWAWMSGDNIIYPSGSWGTQGVVAASNKPSGRTGSAGWKDASGNLWLFGGYGKNASALPSSLSDLWKYDVTTNQWTWVKGGNAGSELGSYGTQGTAAAGNLPGARTDAMACTDASGNFWLFGGNGYASTGSSGNLNDLWKYNPATNEWTWVKGDNVKNVAGVYGTQGTAASTNKPGSRSMGSAWADGSGNLWLFGGSGYSSIAYLAKLNDLWKYNITNNEWTWMKGSSSYNSNPVYGNTIPGSSSAYTTPGARQAATSWTDASGKLWLFGGDGYAAVSNGYLNDLWKYDPVTNEWIWTKGDNSVGVPAVYGTKTNPSPANKPGARNSAVSWTDPGGNLWLFGGQGMGTGGYMGALNDLWRLGNNVPLAIRLISFTGQKKNGVASLDWTTSSNSETQEFIIEKSTDGNQFSAIGSVKAIDDVTAYSYTDLKVAEGTSFYRLKAIAKNGRSFYSTVIRLSDKVIGNIPAIYPNPATTELFINYVQPQHALSYTIRDISGRTMKQQTVVSGNSMYRLDVKDLAPGAYILTIRGQANQPFIKQ